MSDALEAPPSAPGAVLTAAGAVVTVAAPDATAVQVEWQTAAGERVAEVALQRISPHWWSGLLPGARAGARYGLRADGPYRPGEGMRFNANKLLLDPNAHAIDGPVAWHPDLVAAREEGGRSGARISTSDSALHLPRGIIVDDPFDWGADRAPSISWADTVLYEAHCKGLTMGHPEIPAGQRGRYAGLGHPVMLAYLQRLGVTTVQLLPVQQAGLDRAQVQRHVGNYWGYAPVLFAAPDHRFASGADGRQVAEFQAMVRSLHRAGLEVVLDVVFNHTLESDPSGATLNLRGLADGHYYHHRASDGGEYLDTTGCGNAVAAHRPLARRLILDSLRWWVTVCRVDGFRFDLGATLTRGEHGVLGESVLLDEIAADPILSAVKLIIEPWDLGIGGYRLGSFDAPYVEWNDLARHAVRKFWFGHGAAGEFARRIAGSDDVFGGRGPLAGVTYAACHDGFAVHDLVRYRQPRTGANGEGGADALFAGGAAEDGGPDGPAPDDHVLEERRDATARAMVLTTLLALGVPMLSHGDERLQGRLGNANPYCHDSPLTWIDWTPSARADEALACVSAALGARRRWPALRRSAFWPGEGGRESLRWFDAAGVVMSPVRWDGEQHTLLAEAPSGIAGTRLLWIWHAGHAPVRVMLPSATVTWRIDVASRGGVLVGRGWAEVPACTLVLLAGTSVAAR